MTRKSVLWDNSESNNARLARIAAIVRVQSAIAPEILDDIVPRLASEGFNINCLSVDIDIGYFQAAVARALEWHKSVIRRPSGDDRNRTVDTIRTITRKLHEHQDVYAQQVLNVLGLGSTSYRPSVAQFNGVALAALDELYTHYPLKRTPDSQAWFSDLTLLEKISADDVYTCAKKRRAFEGYDKLVHSNGARAVASAAVHVLAKTVSELSITGPHSFEQILDEILPSDTDAKKMTLARVKPAFSRDEFIRFRKWCWFDEEELSIETVCQILKFLLDDAQEAGIDPRNPEEAESWMDLIERYPDPNNVADFLCTVKLFTDFHRETLENRLPWDQAAHKARHRMIAAEQRLGNNILDEL